MNINSQLTNTFLFWIRLLFVSLALAGVSPAKAQPVKAWDKDYGGSGWEDCNAVQQTADFGYILGGITTSGVSGDVSEPSRDDATLPFGFHHEGDFWVLRTDENGDYLWDKRFGGNKEDRMWGVRETLDGGFILGGQSYSDLTGDKTEANRGDSDYWVVKTDADGNYEWDHTYGGDSTDVLNVLIQTQDGGYLLGGWSISSGWSLADSTGEKSDTIRGNFDWWVVKIDSMGLIQWEKTYGGDGEDRLNDIIQLADGTYLLGGGTDSGISGDVDSASYLNRDYWLLQVDSIGNKIGEWRYGGNGVDELNAMVITHDGGRLLGGSSTTLSPSGVKTEAGYGSYDWWLIKTDSVGNIEWQHTFGSDDLENIYSVSQNSVDHYLLGGFSRSAGNDITDPPKGSFDFWIMYLDPDGNKLWDRRCGGNEADVLENLFQTNDGGYLLTGHSQTDVDQDKTDPNNGLNDFWIVKTNCNISVNFNDTIVCPNDPVMLSAYDPTCIDCIYSWEDNNTISDSIRTVTTDTDVTYSVTLTDGVGCQKSDDINITVFTPPTVDLGEDVEICKGAALTLDAENSGLEFAWNTGDSTQSIEVNYPDHYIVSVTNAMGCTTPDSIEISLTNLSAQVITTNTSCGQNNGTATVIASGGTGNYTYTWINGSSEEMLTNLTRGEYAVVVNDGNCQVVAKGIVGFAELPAIDWEHNYGGSDIDAIWDIQETTDGGFITIGDSRSNDGDLIGNSGQYDVWVKKLSNAGNIEWQRTYGGSGHDFGTKILPTANGGYIFTGYTNSTDGDVEESNGSYDIWVVQIDAVGNIIWEETYGGSDEEGAFHIENTFDGGYIISGRSRSSDGDVSNNFGGSDAWVIKINNSGLLEWEHNYGGTENEEIAVIHQRNDGSYIFFAQSSSSDVDLTANYGLQDYWLVNIDRRGNILWQQNYGGSDADRASDMIPTNDGGYLLLGISRSTDLDINSPIGETDYWVLKVNATGDIVWEKSYGSPFNDLSVNIFKNGDDNFIISGYIEGAGGDVSTHFGNDDYWLIKIDPAGNLLWEQNFGGTGPDRLYTTIQTTNGDYLLAGTSSSNDLDVGGNNGGTDEWIIKLNAPPLPNVALPGDAVICATDTLEIAPTISTCEACNWLWSDGSGDSLRALIPLQSTDYEIVVTDIYGCTASDQMTITVNDLPMVDLGGNAAICTGEVLNLDAGNPGAGFEWSNNQFSQAINVTVADTYTVTVTDANACVSVDSMVLTVNPLPVVDLGADTMICDGETYSLDAGNPGADFAWSSTAQNTQSVEVNSSGNYSVTVTDLNNCSATDAMTLEVLPLPQPVDVEAVDQGPHCPGSSFTVNVLNTETSTTYQLYNGSNTVGNPVPGNNGTIQLTTDQVYTSSDFDIIAVNNSLCADSFSVPLTINIGDVEPPMITCRTDTLISIEAGNCDPSLQLAAPLSFSDNCGIEAVTYELTGATTMSSPTEGINFADDISYNIGLTTVTYTAIDSFGNTASCDFTVDVVDNVQPIEGAPASDLTVECDGAGNTAAFNAWLNNQGGATAFDDCSSITWTSEPPNPVLTDDCGETGSVTVDFIATDDSGNSITSTATFTIVDTQAPEFSVPADITISAGTDPDDLNITGDVNDEFDSCDGGVAEGGLREANYVDVVVENGCEDIITRTWSLSDECGNTSQHDQLITVVYDTPQGGISGDTTICQGDTTYLTFNLIGNSNAFDVTFFDGLNSETLFGISDGYSMMVIANFTRSYEITDLVDLARPDCLGTFTETAEIVVNQSPSIENLQETCNLLNTNYVVSFEINNGLAGTYSITGNSGTLNGNTFTSDPIPKDSSYVFYLDDANGCGPVEISGSFDCACVTDAGSLDLNLVTVCGSETATVEHDDFNLDGNDLLQFVLHDGDAATIGNVLYTSNTPDFSYEPGLIYGTTYYITAIAGTNDGNGNIEDSDACYSVSEGAPIIFYEAPEAVIDPVTTAELTCEVTSLFLTGENSTAQGDISFEWSAAGSGNIISATSGQDIEVDQAGIYTLTISDNATGCTHEASIEVTLNDNAPSAIIQMPGLLTCQDSVIGLNAGASSSGNNFSYAWNGGTIVSGENSLFPEVAESTTYTLLVIDENNGCTATAEVFVDADFVAPTVDAGPVQVLDCIDTEVMLSGSFTTNASNTDLEWLSTNGNFVSGQSTLNPVVDQPAVYVLQVTNLDNGCVGTDEVLVENDPEAPQDAIIEAFDPRCFGDKNGSISIVQVLGGIEPYHYSIDGENFYAFTNFTNLAAGDYQVIIQDARGCEFATSLSLTEPPELEVELGDNIQIELGDSVQLQALINQAIDTFVWNPGSPLSCEGCLDPFVQPIQQSTYQISVETASGCKAEDYVTVVVRKDRKVYIPTAFSPNGDGINDFFTIYGDKSVTNIAVFRIFDRWGALLFEAENLPVNSEPYGWNGTFKNKPVQQGVYVFFAEIEYFDGLKEIIKGDITVMF